MTREEFEIVATNATYCQCECTYKRSKYNSVLVGESICFEYDSLHIAHFTLGRHPNNVTPTPEQPQKMLISEAQKLGLKKGDRVWIELDVEFFDDGDNTIKLKHPINGSVIYTKANSTQIIYAPQPYTPKHRELCAVVTTTGLTTECEVFESNGRLFAISLILGKPDGVFCPEQIEKFLPLKK